ncbi:phospholipid-transporting ATPase IF [Drosophila grimshawi]|uniref:Phospholipid-transporting ATPase n=1 Tax=Drosophila grimshawi TaxID=7222 RepID=B4JKM5_DROGR|nr:phospholipid-transporting ATPase IF [Drosophila grimshawi]EDW00128.1 GH12031 [Drosophila grimshawi]
MAKSSNKEKKPLRISIGNVNPRKNLPLNRVTTTKYTWLTFIPLNFYEQFRRAVYFYFLIITIISFFVNITLSPLVSLLPLLFVMIVTALKEGLEDYARSKNDKIVNKSQVTVIRNGNEEHINSEFIVPGDIVVVTSASDVTCDLLLLHTSGAEKMCFVNTANLDGETNLKAIHIPHNFTYDINGQNLDKACIICEPSTSDLYRFNGRIEFETTVGIESNPGPIPLEIDNLLLRGVRIKGQGRVLGCAVYTGMSTKLQLNSRYTGNKSASSEKYINKFIIALIVGMVAVVLILYMIERQKAAKVYPSMYYLGPPIDYNKILQIFEDFLSFLILFNYMVPISMYMNIELYRVFGALFMKSDLELYDEKTDQPCAVNASNLNEDLGQINILFSDKTGTLTKNQMIFVKCFTAGKNYHLQNIQLYCPDDNETYELGMMNNETMDFFVALALCHTVDILDSCDEKSGETLPELENLIPSEIISRYQASSPDEKAILEGCAKLGLIFKDITDDQIRLGRIFSGTNASDLQFERLHVLEFSSERKRMSVIIRDESGVIWLYIKGAESSILPRCNPTSLIAQTDEQITKYAKEGLRTLAVARRTLTESEYDAFVASCDNINIQLNNRQELLAECYQSIEVGLDLLGATALEDTLEDEVDDTLTALQEAGLKIWVLTGDKVETAFSIGMACKHIPQVAEVHFLIGITDPSELEKRLSQLELGIASATSKPTCLVIDGTTVSALLSHLPEQFTEVALKCQAVLCCRLSPLQKSEIVMRIKKTGKHITAAIGDGANDVSMIQEAHIGIGIYGVEGKQAARSADYAIAKFKMLQRLLLVHGHYNTERLAFMVLFYCYKNIIITGCMALFQVYDLYSATSVYNELFLWLFDIIYISVSFTYLAMSDKHYNEKTLLRFPTLYKGISHNQLTSWKIFTVWIINGALQCFTIFYFAYAVLNDNNVVFNNGQTADFSTFGTMLIMVLVIVGNLKIVLVSHYMSYLNFVFIVASIFAFILSTYLYNLYTGSSLYHVYSMFLSSLPIWLYIIICTVTCLLPDFLMKAVYDMFLDPPKLKVEKLKRVI